MNDSKTALVTGGSRGIGLGIVKELLKNNFNVAINGIREEKEVQDQLDKLRSIGPNVHYIQGDIGTTQGRANIIQCVQNIENLNILINNAGVAPQNRKDILDINSEDYDYVMDINLKGTFFLTQAVAKMMMMHKLDDPDFEACLINISSISAEMASINRAEYCISKAGISMLTKLMAVKMSEVNIPVYEVRPGIIKTDMTASVTKKYEQLIADGLTLEQRMGEPEDIGKIVASLVNGNLPYSTGQVFTPDGGMMVRRL